MRGFGSRAHGQDSAVGEKSIACLSLYAKAALLPLASTSMPLLPDGKQGVLSDGQQGVASALARAEQVHQALQSLEPLPMHFDFDLDRMFRQEAQVRSLQLSVSQLLSYPARYFNKYAKAYAVCRVVYIKTILEQVVRNLQHVDAKVESLASLDRHTLAEFAVLRFVFSQRLLREAQQTYQILQHILRAQAPSQTQAEIETGGGAGSEGESEGATAAEA